MPSTITAYTTFVPNTTIYSSEVNANFSNHRGTNIPINTDTATASNLTHDLGSTEHRWSNAYVDKINLGQTTTSWKIQDATTTVQDLQFKANNVVKFAVDTSGAIVVPTFDTVPSSNPAAGFNKMYFDTVTSKWKYINSSGTESDISGGVGGGLNLETAPYGTETSGWSTYDDGASASMVDGTGGSPGITFGADVTETQILNGGYSGTYKITYDAADRQGEGGSKTFTIPQAFMDRGAVYVSCRYSADVAFSTGDFGFYAYDVTNATLLNVNGLTSNNLVGLAADKAGYFTAVIYIASNTASLRLGFHRKVTTATATVFHFSDLKVSDIPLVDCPIVGEEESVTVTLTNISSSSLLAKRKRIGGLAKYSVSLISSGAASGTIKINLPSGDTIDYIKLNSSTYNTVGTAFFYDASTGNCYQGTVRTDNGANAVYINAEAGGQVWNATSPVTVASSDIIDLNFELPLSNFSNQNAVLSTTAMMNQTVKATYYVSSTAAIPNSATIFDFSTKLFDSHNAVTTGASWKFTAPKTGYYKVSSTIPVNTTTTTSRYDISVYKNGSAYHTEYDTGHTIAQILTSRVECTVQLNKGDYIDIRHSETVNNASYISTQSIDIEELPDFSVYSVYGQTKVTEASAYSQTYSIAANTWGDLTSISLEPGTYDIFLQCGWYNDGAVTAGACCNGISTYSGNDTTGLVTGDNMMLIQNPGTTAFSIPNSVHKRDITVTTTTTYYLKAAYTQAITNLKVSYKISARKIK